MGGDRAGRTSGGANRGFNPRLRMGGDVRLPDSAVRCRRFNPRLRMGGDVRLPDSAVRCRRFNPRLRMGGDVTPYMGGYDHEAFQSTPPHGRRQDKAAICACSPLFQSTPPHGRRHVDDAVRRTLPRFNPRLRMGGDYRSIVHARCCDGFNPRLRMGGDPRIRALSGAQQPVSIHASAWEATNPGQPLRLSLAFQSTPPHGRRRASLGVQNSSAMFQSTPPLIRTRASWPWSLSPPMRRRGLKPSSPPPVIAIKMSCGVRIAIRQQLYVELEFAPHRRRRGRVWCSTGASPRRSRSPGLPSTDTATSWSAASVGAGSTPRRPRPIAPQGWHGAP